MALLRAGAPPSAAPEPVQAPEWALAESRLAGLATEGLEKQLRTLPSLEALRVKLAELLQWYGHSSSSMAAAVVKSTWRRQPPGGRGWRLL